MNRPWENTANRYGALSIGLHWLMLTLLIAVYAAINLHDAAPKGSALRADLKTWHFIFGLSVFILVAVRLATRLFAGTAPAIVPPVPHWQHFLAKLVHAGLYLFMVVMPLLGWSAISAKGDPIVLFGMPLPALISGDKALYDTLKTIHKTVGTFGYYLIGLHAAAALFHHYIRGDNTLLRIVPKWRRY